MKEIRIEAKVHNLEEVQQFVNEQLIEHGCPAKVRTQISIAVEEIFVNIASYAYDPGTGAVQIQTDIVFNPRKIEISLLTRVFRIIRLRRTIRTPRFPRKDVRSADLEFSWSKRAWTI